MFKAIVKNSEFLFFDYVITFTIKTILYCKKKKKIKSLVFVYLRNCVEILKNETKKFEKSNLMIAVRYMSINMLLFQ